VKIFEPDSQDTLSLFSRRWILLLLAVYVTLAIAFSVSNPLHEATDELRHYRFVRTIATTARLPVQGQESCRSQSHHPPLYYALGALATFWINTGRDLCESPPDNPFWAYRYWEVGNDNKNQYLHGPEEAFPWRGEALAAYLMRGLNIVIGAAVVWLTWATSRVIWPRRKLIAMGAAAFVAFNPMFLYMSGAINNDIIAALSGSAILFASLYMLHDPQGLNLRWGLILGALYGLALMSKSNLAAAILLIELAITWLAWRRYQWRQWLSANLLLLAVAALIAGWWFVRNQQLYGDLTGFSTVTELWGVRDPAESFALAISELPYAWSTLWGRFGFGQIPLPQAIYAGLLVGTTAGLSGATIGFIWRANRQEKTSLIFLMVDIILFFLVLFGYMLVSPAGPNGRFFFPALSALAMLTFFGLIQWISLIRHGLIAAWSRIRRRELTAVKAKTSLNIAGLMLIFGMLGLAIISLFGFLRPAYARPPSLSPVADIPNQVNAQFDSLVTLLGYDLSTVKLQPGDALDIELYWEVNVKPPGNYLLFVHLTDVEGSIITQRDTHPGLGNFPSSHWEVGDRFVDTIRVFIPETAYTPAEVELSIGLYDPLAYRLAVSAEDGRPMGDSLHLADLTIAPIGGSYPNHQRQNFSDELSLVGYEYSELEVKPGDTLELILYWKALENVESDYTVQINLFDESDTSWSQSSHRLEQGNVDAKAWTPGQVVSNTHTIAIDPDTPSGTYVVDIALLYATTRQILNIVANDGHWIDSHLALAPIRVRS
jgi:4-amino-4-deoxy-L-arabinose transferase-like glycosyltransferase